MADAIGLGPIGRKALEVQVLSSAQRKIFYENFNAVVAFKSLIYYATQNTRKV